MNSNFEKAISMLKEESFGKVLNNLGNALNSFTPNYEEFFNALKESKVAKASFEKIMLLAMCAHGYQYIIEEKSSVSPHWDDRDKSSRYMCYKSLDTLLPRCEETLGKVLFKTESERSYRLVSTDVIPGSLSRDLMDEVVYFLYGEHPTLRQSIIRLFRRYCEEQHLNYLKVDMALPLI